MTTEAISALDELIRKNAYVLMQYQRNEKALIRLEARHAINKRPDLCEVARERLKINQKAGKLLEDLQAYLKLTRQELQDLQ